MSDLLLNSDGNSSSNILDQPNAIAVSPLDNAENKVAATTIQKYFRGSLARKPCLPCNLYTEYKVQCDRVNGPQSKLIPQAQGGKTRVYLPLEMPGVVLKRSGKKDAITRFHQMQEVRSILDSQNSSHLIIPKARLCQDFLVEERLPINVNKYHNMGLYLSDPTLFDDAVRELTRLFSKLYLSDLVNNNYNPLTDIDGVEDYVRYDNLPLYLVEEGEKRVGKIGLIDLEHTEKSPNPKGLETLVRIFPFHLDLIKEEASLLEMEVKEPSLEVSAERGRKYLQVGFIDHLKWLKAKDVSAEISSKDFQVSPERSIELTTLLEQELLKLNQGVNDYFTRRGIMDKPQNNFFIGNPEEIARELAENITPLILSNMKAILEENQNKELSKISVGDIPESDLVRLRSPIIKRPELYKDVVDLINSNEKIKFKNTFIGEQRDIAEQLTYIIMEELVKSGEIFHFDPTYLLPNEVCLIRY
jgi:hypothetical protein